MTPGEFIAKWRASELKERSASQEHFIDLCRLLGEPTPAEGDPIGERNCFERGARKDTGGDGWADVWKRHCFAWEYKGKHRLFAWLDARICPDHQLIVIAGDDDTTFGILHSRLEGRGGKDDGCGALPVPDQAADCRQALAAHHALGGEAVSPVMDVHAIESGLGP